MTQLTMDTIHKEVRQRYGKVAATSDAAAIAIDPFSGGSNASCCGDGDNACGCNSQVSLYDIDTTALPTEVTNLSLGCGDPITLAALQPGQTVLDLGSGGGIDCFLAAKQVGETGRVIGVDMTPEMLAKAQRNKEKVGATNVEFRQGFIEQLPVESNSVDVIISNCVINLSPDKPAVFREVFRVLKPGGRVAVSDMVVQGRYSAEQRANMNDWAACITGAEPVQDYVGAMAAAGLAQISVQDKSAPGVEFAETVLDLSQPRLFSARITAVKPS